MSVKNYLTKLLHYGILPTKNSIPRNMIETFSHKGLQELFTNGKTKRLPQEITNKINKLLAMIDNAEVITDLAAPSNRLHKLKAPPYRGYWSIDVTGNYRIIFEFSNGKATNLNYIDTH